MQCSGCLTFFPSRRAPIRIDDFDDCVCFAQSEGHRYFEGFRKQQNFVVRFFRLDDWTGEYANMLCSMFDVDKPISMEYDLFYI